MLALEIIIVVLSVALIVTGFFPAGPRISLMWRVLGFAWVIFLLLLIGFLMGRGSIHCG